jgi:hypothetical protein
MEYLQKPFSVISFARILPLINLQLKWCMQTRFCIHYCVYLLRPLRCFQSSHNQVSHDGHLVLEYSVYN